MDIKLPYKKIKVSWSKNLYRTVFYCVAFSIISLFALAQETSAASLYLSPTSGNYVVGQTFTVDIKVNSNAADINSAEATVTFPSDKLSALSVSKSGSIFELWTQSPAITGNKIIFTGGLTSGFSGIGTIATITFKAKVPGVASVKMGSARVLAHDGQGTNILSTSIGGAYTIQGATIIPPIVTPAPVIPPIVTPAPITGRTPLGPQITSATHPDTGKWYTSETAKFSWQLPKDVNAVRISINKIPNAKPTVLYKSPIASKEITDLEEGIWYFHAQFRNKSGWGDISHYRIRIDTEAPAPFEIIVKEDKESIYPKTILSFETSDEISGMDYYEVKIDLDSPIIIKETEYEVLGKDAGKHSIIVKAVDRAGNYILAMEEINILSIEAPVITNYPRELLPGGILSVKGTALPDVTVIFYIQKDGKEVKIGETESSKDGKWVYIDVEPLKEGIYQAWAVAVNSSGVKSDPSEKVTIKVNPPAFISIGKLIINYHTTIMILLILISAIISGVFWLWLIIKEKNKKIKKEIGGVKRLISRAFKTLKTEIEEQVAKLDGKPGLSKEEKRICNDLKKALKNSEKFIDKEIKDIEKELE